MRKTVAVASFKVLTPWNRVLFEKLTGFQPAKKFPAFYGTRRFITAFISVRRLSPFFLCEHFVTFLRWGVVSTSPNPQSVGWPLVGCPRVLIQYIRSYPPYWRPFLHPQRENAPCRGDRDPPDHGLKGNVSHPLWDRGPVNSFFIRRGPGPNRFTRR